MDSLNYTYYPGTNKLKRITDPHGTNSTYSDLANQPKVENYTYDAIGNLQSDSLETLHSIKWNVYGKIRELSKTTGHWSLTRKTRFEYDAQGNRISKASQINNNWNYTWYVRDAQGNILSNYSATSNDPKNHQNANLWQDERNIYGSSRLGHYDFSITAQIDNQNNGPIDVRADAINTHNRGRKQYEITNHLGNVVTTITDRKFGVASPSNSSLVGYYQSDITGAVEYYPFGMAAKGVTTAGYTYRFGFNGKENDNDIKGGFGLQQDYGNRIYDPRVGRFLSVDRLQTQFPDLSAYQFSGNTPIQAFDIDGLEPKGFMHLWESGEEYMTNYGFSVRDVYDYETKQVWSVMSYPNTSQYFYWQTKYENSQRLFKPLNTELNKSGNIWTGKFKEFVPKTFKDDRSLHYATVVMLVSPFIAMGVIEGGIAASSALEVHLAKIATDVATKGIYYYYKYAPAAGLMGRNVADFLDESGSVGLQNASIRFNATKVLSESFGHILSKNHLQSGLDMFGKTEGDILRKVESIINSNMKDLKEGDNFIETTINGVKGTVKAFVSDGEIKSVNAVKGEYSRKYNNVILDVNSN